MQHVNFTKRLYYGLTKYYLILIKYVILASFPIIDKLFEYMEYSTT